MHSCTFAGKGNYSHWGVSAAWAHGIQGWRLLGNLEELLNIVGRPFVIRYY